MGLAAGSSAGDGLLCGHSIFNSILQVGIHTKNRWTRDIDGGVGSNHNTDQHRKCEVLNDTATKNVMKHAKKVVTEVRTVRDKQSLMLILMLSGRSLPNPKLSSRMVIYHDRIVQRVTDDGQERSDDRQVKLQPHEAENTDCDMTSCTKAKTAPGL